MDEDCQIVTDYSTCDKCGHQVPTSNLQLHSLRCNGSSAGLGRAATPSGTGPASPAPSSPLYPSAHSPTPDQLRSPSPLVRYPSTSYGGSVVTTHRDDSSSRASPSSGGGGGDDSDCEIYASYPPPEVVEVPRPSSRESPSSSRRTRSSARIQTGTRAARARREPPWVCTRCTYENRGDARECEMCDGPRDLLQTPAPSRPQPSATLGGVSPLPEGWDCPMYVRVRVDG